MATYRIQHCFQGGSGSSRDKFCNTLYYTSAISPDTAAAPSGVHGDLIADNVRAFYAGGTDAISNYLSSEVQNPFRTIRIYDVAAAADSPALYSATDVTSPWAGGTPQALPEEVAVVMSFSAITTGANPARRRGRIFLGPLNVSAIDDSSSAVGPVHVAQAFIISITSAATIFKGDMAADDATWCVYSPSDAGAYEVVQATVDNAFDTMRKRGVAASSSTSLAV